MTKLEDWLIDRYRGEVVLVGRVYGHRQIEDGHRVITSRIQYVNFIEKVAHTVYTRYALGKSSDVLRDVIPKELQKHDQ